MAEVREVDADLVLSPRAWQEAEQGERLELGFVRTSNLQHRTPNIQAGRPASPHWVFGVGCWMFDVSPIPHSPLHPKLRLRRRSVQAHAILNGYRAAFIFPQRRVNQSMLFPHLTVDDGEVFFLNCPGFPDAPQFACRRRVFGDHRHAAGFAIQPVYEVWLAVSPEMEPHPTDQAGKFVAFGRMTDEVGRFIDDQQVRVLVDDVEKLVQVRQ